jgi:hypothetical protein
MTRPPGADIYHVVVIQSAQTPPLWGWELYRNGSPLPIRVRDRNFKSERTATAAGKVALRDFLEALDREQNN